jgi:hypothetical protein
MSEERGFKPRSGRTWLWALMIASIGGLLGLVGMEGAPGVYTVQPPPLPGYPLSYQTVPNCNAGPLGVCPPNVENSIAIASVDFSICFAVTFLVSILVLIFFRPYLTTPATGARKRNALPAALLLIAVLLVSVAASSSAASGASLTLPRYQMSGGAPVYPLGITIYSGSATCAAAQGTARMTLILANYDGSDLSEPISLYLVGPNVTASPVPIFQCPDPETCHLVSAVRVPSYTALALNTTTTAFYLGIPIKKGAQYNFYVNMTGEGMATSGIATAL